MTQLLSADFWLFFCDARGVGYAFCWLIAVETGGVVVGLEIMESVGWGVGKDSERNELLIGRRSS